MLKQIEVKLKIIYKENYNESYLNKFKAVLDNYSQIKDIKKPNHKTVYLITYGDAIQNKNEKTLKTLNDFLNEKFKNIITDVHILPMFPYTSDDGFSVVDYQKVDEKLGDFTTLEKFSKEYRLMYDFVVNHISKSSKWFVGYLNEEETYKDYFIKYDERFDYKNVVRPRTSDLISKYQNNKTAWTTFSEDQVDLNFKNIDVLVKTTEILLDYIKKGATSIRLDAIGFLWKESGTSCMHLKETHEVIKIWRIILDEIAPNVQIITETNVPHLENISYFGNKNDEANQVYQFALPPLVLHSFISGSSEKFNGWASGIEPLSKTATYFNFLASHDGIGMRSVENILSEEQKEKIIENTKKNGAKFNFKTNTDGTKSVYEINITYLDAIKKGDKYDNSRFLGAHFILLSMPGNPAIYYNSFLGTTNNVEEVLKTNINRRINRRKFSKEEIDSEMQKSSKKEIFDGLKEMIEIKQKHECFSPYGEFEILNVSKSVIGINKRFKGSNITALINITDENVKIKLEGYNLNKKEKFNQSLEAYEYAWIKHE